MTIMKVRYMNNDGYVYCCFTITEKNVHNKMSNTDLDSMR